MLDKKEISFSDSTDVYFHELSREQIEFYVDKYKPYDKARRLCYTGMDRSGGYQISRGRFL